jgi:predicted nucleotidyltransferase
MDINKMLLRDGDTLLMQEGFIFYVFGYEHPDNRLLSFLKYIPSEFAHKFQVRLLKHKWHLEGIELSRPEKLYTAQNYQKFLVTLRRDFPHYLYFCPHRSKEVLSVPRNKIKKVYASNECLRRIFQNENKDTLQKEAIELVELLSSESKVPIQDFGIHGSVGLNMHNEHSDIDLVVYGAQNFKNLESAVNRLADEEVFTHVFTKKIDQARKHRCRYNDRRFVYNAVRKPKEIDTKHGRLRYTPIKNVQFVSEVVNDNENMFRPAVYAIKDYKPFDLASELSDEQIPVIVTSMIGYYRNVARTGDKIRVSGALEKVDNIETGEMYYHVVVGTGIHGNEYIEPMENLTG